MVSDYRRLFDLEALKLDELSLAVLGTAMDGGGRSGNVTLDAGYVYLGQFISHDLTKLRRSEPLPVRHGASEEELQNLVTSSLDLDCVYGSGEEDNNPVVDWDTGKFVLRETIASTVGDMHLKATSSDLPRRENLEAWIPDIRNDDNLITAQLHVLFLKLHNSITDRPAQEPLVGSAKYDNAQKEVSKIFHGIVLYDYLKQVLHEPVYEALIERSEPLLPDEDDFKGPLPLEFSLAAGRFGHSMVRANYRINDYGIDGIKSITELFALSSGGSRLQRDGGLQQKFVVDWDFFFRPNNEESIRNPARPIDSFIGFQVRADEISDKTNLAARNLKRANELGLASAQAIIDAILEAYPEYGENASNGGLGLRKLAAWEFDEDFNVLDEPGISESLKSATPLWFYILGEANYYSGGRRLGPLGSLLLGSAIVGILRPPQGKFEPSSFISSLGGEEKVFTMRDVIDYVRSNEEKQ